MSNRKANDTLGMPYGTAAHRLRKLVLFNQLKKHDENICVKCGLLIDSVYDLSIEHLKPWEGISAELFWDLNNIAFSHLRCNVPHVRRGGAGNKIHMPEGMNWCAKHQQFLPIEKFTKHSYTHTGLNRYCKDCQHYNRKSDFIAAVADRKGNRL